MAELSGRIEAMEEGLLKAGAGKYTSIHGIDSLYYNYAEMVKKGYTSRSGYLAALASGEATGEISVLESKWRRTFSMEANPESLLGPGIKVEIDEKTAFLRQMSPGWIREVQDRLSGSAIPSARLAFELLENQGYARRYINVLNGEGQALLWRMR
ncbi:MAG: hypothetical protein WBX15_09410 [Thermoanaerobaculia bacterium]